MVRSAGSYEASWGNLSRADGDVVLRNMNGVACPKHLVRMELMADLTWKRPGRLLRWLPRSRPLVSRKGGPF